MAVENGTRPELILASVSPRRKELLASLGLRFEVVPPAFDEGAVAVDEPGPLVEALALGKATSVSERRPDALVIGADTVVVLDGRILGKPKDPDDARAMLAALSGRTHRVYTGVSVVHGASGRKEVGHEVTEVRFGPLTPEQIDRYVRTGEPLDKAGAYGIQGYGATLVQSVNGCYFTVVGLPLYRLARMLAKHDVIVP